jgi:hypothetical protein
MPLIDFFHRTSPSAEAYFFVDLPRRLICLQVAMTPGLEGGYPLVHDITDGRTRTEMERVPLTIGLLVWDKFWLNAATLSTSATCSGYKHVDDSRGHGVC